MPAGRSKREVLIYEVRYDTTMIGLHKGRLNTRHYRIFNNRETDKKNSADGYF